jgi:extracellular factor (EF) 3-hydroxypalmitic acid methyl ester biosynthesis protein
MFLAKPDRGGASQPHRLPQVERLHGETSRIAAQGGVARIFNLGCGPAQEIQNFPHNDDLCDNADILLLDFNDETITNTTRDPRDLRGRHRRRTGRQMVKNAPCIRS